jgi:predicted nucleic acid-binding protein
MSAEVFVDTNVLFYALTDGPDGRHARARERVSALWETPGVAAISVQVLQELHVNLVRKAGLSVPASIERITPYLAWPVIDNDSVLLKSAFDLQVRSRLSFWDATIVVAAQRAGVRELWSEDMQAGQRFDHVTVANPLLPTG